MKVTYTPGEGDVQEFSFVPDDVPQSQAEMIEKRYGGNWDDFLTAIRSGNARSRRVLLWHLLRQTHHTLRFEDVPDFKMGAVKVAFDAAELQELRDRVNKANLPTEERDELLAALDIEIIEAMEAEGKAPTADTSTTPPTA